MPSAALLVSVVVPASLAVAAPLLVVRSQVATYGPVEDGGVLQEDLGLVLATLGVSVVVGLLAGVLWGCGRSLTASVAACAAVAVVAVPTLGGLVFRLAGDRSALLTAEVDLAVGGYGRALAFFAGTAVLTAVATRAAGRGRPRPRRQR